MQGQSKPEDYFTSGIDKWFLERSLALHKPAKTAKRDIEAAKLEFGVSKVIRSISDHEAERRKKSAARSRA